MKLTDTQLIVLSKAAQRDDGVGAVPVGMKSAAAIRVGASLVTRKLMREVRAKPGMPIWRRDEDDRPISLVLLRAGRDAIRVDDNADETDAVSVGKNANEKRLSKLKEKLPSGAARRVHESNERTGVVAPTPRAGSKQALVINMLSADAGATIHALIEATGWLPHTTRAVLTELRKRGYRIERTRDSDRRASFYRIVDQQAA